jgi:hypothetical protein
MPSEPTPEFIAHFASDLPEPAFNTDRWAFGQYAARYTIPQPQTAKPLDGHVLRTGFCTAEASCVFSMKVLLLQEGLVAENSNGVMRYVMLREDGFRREVYALWHRPEQVYAYYIREGDQWVLLREDDAIAEHDFVQTTWGVVAELVW